MASDRSTPSCRLCHAPLRESELSRQLCAVCDEYAQHVALQANERLERVVGVIQNGPTFTAASRNEH